LQVGNLKSQAAYQMAMGEDFEIMEIDGNNVERYKLFCKKSKSKTEPYRQKLDWFLGRLGEGLKYHLLLVNENGKMASRGFIEYIPGEYAWRAVYAKGYDVIHCLWVTGRHKEKGHGSRLLDRCLQESAERGSKGVAVVTSSKVWMAGSEIFEKKGFRKVDGWSTFELLVKKFGDAPDPLLPGNWEKRAEAFGDGLTVVRANQCPFIQDAEDIVREYAGQNGMQFRSVILQTAAEVRERAPSPYGVFNLVKNGELISYHYLLKKDLDKVLA